MNKLQRAHVRNAIEQLHDAIDNDDIDIVRNVIRDDLLHALHDTCDDVNAYDALRDVIAFDDIEFNAHELHDVIMSLIERVTHNAHEYEQSTIVVEHIARNAINNVRNTREFEIDNNAQFDLCAIVDRHAHANDIHDVARAIHLFVDSYVHDNMMRALQFDESKLHSQ